jgi:hypothetical protein
LFKQVIEGREARWPICELDLQKEEADQAFDRLQRFFYYHIIELFYNFDLPFLRHVVNDWNAY